MNILATSGGFRYTDRYELSVGPLVQMALELSNGTSRPRLCMLGTAGGDDSVWTGRAYAAFARDRPDVQVSHLDVFPMPNIANIREHLLAQDVIWVGGGSVANLITLWRLHGIDKVMREAWESGVVTAGVSAGALCWHVGGTTDSFGPDLRCVKDLLGLVPFSTSPHYNSESQRRPLYQSLVASGELPSGWATDDGVGVHYRGQEMVEAVADRPDAYAWRVEQGPDGTAIETCVEPRRLD